MGRQSLATVSIAMTRGRSPTRDPAGALDLSVVVPAFNAIPIPDEVSSDVAAIMMCSTATAYHALRLSGMQKGDSVAVLGFGEGAVAEGDHETVHAGRGLEADVRRLHGQRFGRRL